MPGIFGYTKVIMILRRNFFLFLISLVLINAPAFATGADDSLITFLYVGEPATRDAALLSKQVFTGNDPAKACSYMELLQSAQTVARTLGANVVKVDKHRERTRQQFCDEINVSFYKVADIHTVERHFSWTHNRKLAWVDFKGPVRAGTAPNNAAETAYGIAVETSTVSAGSVPKVYFVNSFETATSWVRPGHDTYSVLMHEQTHFDICELYTRKMRERISKVTITLSNLQTAVRDAYRPLFQECADRQQRYDEETRHGTDDLAQARWTKMINTELSTTEAWNSN